MLLTRGSAGLSIGSEALDEKRTDGDENRIMEIVGVAIASDIAAGRAAFGAPRPAG